MRRALLTACCLAALGASASAPGVAFAASSVTYSAAANTFTYTGDAAANSIVVGTKLANSGDISPTGTAPNTYVFLDSALPAVAPCVEYHYDPPDLFFPVAEDIKVGIACPGDANDTVTVSAGDGDDGLYPYSSFFCGSFFSSQPCIDPPARAVFAGGGPGNDILSGGNGPNTLTGGAGDDLLTGGPGVDALDGGEGRDTVMGLLGADDLRGGPGIDEVQFTYTNDRVLVSLNDLADDGAIVPGPVEGDNVHTDIEDVTGGGGPDILNGSSGSNTLTGGNGGDQLDGGGGIDIFYGQADADTLNTRDGNSERVDCGDDGDVLTSDSGDQKSGCEVDSTSSELEGDLDGDGVKAPGDCNDRDAAIKPGANDAPDNGIDENCDGSDATLSDRDKDGFTVPADCDDANPAAKPGAVEVYGNGVDENCNGAADPFRPITAFVSSSFRPQRRTTSVALLRVSSLRAGSTVTVTCSGKPRACAFSSKAVNVTKDTRTLDLRARLKLRAAKVGGRLDVRISHPDSLSRRTSFTFKRSKLPTSKTQCIQVKTGKYGTCP